MIIQDEQSFKPDFLVCPRCQSFTKQVEPIADTITGIIFGYDIECPYCCNVTALGLVNSMFKLFDLSSHRSLDRDHTI